MKYKYYIVAIIILLLVFSAIIFLDENDDQSLSPRDALEQGLSQLRTSGAVSAEQEPYLRVQLAIADYLSQYGEPPNSLEDLIPRYFDSVPLDHTTKEPISYSRKGMEFELNIIGLDDDENEQSSKTAKRNSAEIEFINPNTVELEEFVYDPSGKRDPFQPFDFSPKTVIDESLPPLERYDISQLRASAILIDGEGERFAIVEDASGKGHTVKIGTRVGNRNGAVVSIDEKKVNVLESETDFTGETRQNLVSIELNVGGRKKTHKNNK